MGKLNVDGTEIQVLQIEEDDISSSVDVLFMHGTKANEILAVKAAKRLQKDYSNIKIVCHNGLAHCENALFHPDKWYADIIDFLN